MYGVIYKAVSNIDGRVYIGLSTNFRQRLYDYKSCHKHPKRYFEYAVAKYGFDNFQFYIIDYSDSLESLNHKEKFWIRIYSSDIRGIGFNLDHGGNGKGSMSDETKSKLSKVKTGKMLGKDNPMYGKNHTPETRGKMSENHADLSGENSAKAKLNWEIVREIRSNEYNFTIDELSKKYNICRTTIHKILNNKTWVVSIDEINKIDKEKYTKQNSFKRAQLDWVEVNDIRINNDNLSNKDLSRKFNVTVRTICRIINNESWKISQDEFDQKYKNKI